MSLSETKIPESFDDLYASTSPMLYAFCLRILQSREDAEDVVQQTYINAWRARRGFRGESRVSTWLLTIARRLAYRTAQKRTEVHAQMPEELAQAPSHVSERVAAEQAIARLPAKMRVAITLYYLHDRSIRETAKIMGVARGTVKAHLHTARRRLRSELQ